MTTPTPWLSTWQHRLTLVLLLALALGGYTLYRVIPHYGIAKASADGWQLVATGWHSLQYAWPLLLLGLLLGGLLSGINVHALYQQAIRQDQRDREQQQQQILTQAAYRVQQAEARAEQHYHSRYQQLQAREAAAAAQAHQAQTTYQQARVAIEQAAAAQAEADARRQRAYHGFKRLQRKQARQTNPEQGKTTTTAKKSRQATQTPS